MKLRSKIKKVKNTGFKFLVNKTIEKIKFAFKYAKYSIKDNSQSSYSEKTIPALKTGLFKISAHDLNEELKHSIIESAESVYRHEFDMLGSGKIKISHKTKYNGWEGYSYTSPTEYNSIKDLIINSINKPNTKKSLLIASLLPDDYEPIDWHSDFKCGYKWDSLRRFNDTKPYPKPGADIKVPWELGRMQHLPVLALAYSISNDAKYAREVQNQVLDFIAFNPPRFGVNWSVTMEVAIRAVNFLIAIDLLFDNGFNFSSEVEDIIYSSLYDHYFHIRKFPEFSGGMRGNHYLAGIAGQLFLAVYLSTLPEVSANLNNSIVKFYNEIFVQFNSDGGNFESSLPYHVFTTEIVVFTFYLLTSYYKQTVPGKASTPEEYFPDNVIREIDSIVRFTHRIAEGINSIPQIGDNDSAVFIDLFNRRNNLNTYDIIQKLRLVCSFDKTSGEPVMFEPIDLFRQKNSVLNHLHFKDFGLYIHRQDNYKLFVRCGKPQPWNKAGHAHNDQLSITLFVNGREVICDPGTLTYTAIPGIRNEYRSVKLHNTLIVKGHEQDCWEEGDLDELFWLTEFNSNAQIIKSEENLFEGVHFAYPKPHFRSIKFEWNNIFITDKCEFSGQKEIALHFLPGVEVTVVDNKCMLNGNFGNLEITFPGPGVYIDEYYYSPRYGKKLKAQRIIKPFSSHEIKWSIKIY